MDRLRLAVHKFSSCDGCQLALLNAGEALLELASTVEIVHFLEAGPNAPEAEVDIALVEGSISTAEEAARIRQVRQHSRWLVTMGACATSGGLQALRNLDAREAAWRTALYARPEFIDSLARAEPVRAHVEVDLELWGCPVTTRQVVSALASLVRGVPPPAETEILCQACKRAGHVCVLASASRPCLGPVVRSSCGALCPGLGRPCYGCSGPVASSAEVTSLTRYLRVQGQPPETLARRLLFFHSQAEAFRTPGLALRDEVKDG